MLVEFLTKNKKMVFILLAVIIIAVFFMNNTDSKKDRAIETAMAEVKSQVVSNQGQIPELKASILYENGSDYIVLVKYDGSGILSGSIVCHVYGNNQKYIRNTLKPMSYSYRYNVEEIKALWKIK